jgi:hypothetical protein
MRRRPARLPSGKLLFTANGDLTGRIFIFDPATTTWSTPTRAPFRTQDGVQLALRDGRVAWFGSRLDPVDAGGGFTISLMSAIYDESTNSWTRGTTIVGRSAMYVTERSCGELLVIAAEWDHGVAMYFDPSRGTWRNTTFGKLFANLGDVSVLPSRHEGFFVLEEWDGRVVTFE